ncbi:hypothetical protein CLOP_g12955 [Closterium sp. NIES-67]|nr:hypothetical protein CLOP_g12955 [Closterium sp. NIES-67]
MASLRRLSSSPASLQLRSLLARRSFLPPSHTIHVDPPCQQLDRTAELRIPSGLDALSLDASGLDAWSLDASGLNTILGFPHNPQFGLAYTSPGLSPLEGSASAQALPWGEHAGAGLECGRGDKRTRRGKIFKGSYGNARRDKKRENQRLREKWELPPGVSAEDAFTGR